MSIQTIVPSTQTTHWLLQNTHWYAKHRWTTYLYYNLRAVTAAILVALAAKHPRVFAQEFRTTLRLFKQLGKERIHVNSYAVRETFANLIRITVKTETVVNGNRYPILAVVVPSLVIHMESNVVLQS